MASLTSALPPGWVKAYSEAAAAHYYVNHNVDPPHSTWEPPTPVFDQSTPSLSPTPVPEVIPATMPTPQPLQPPTKFTALELQQITAVAIEKNPYLASHGRKKEQWAEAAKELHRQGLCLNSTTGTIRNKVEALIKHHRNPNPRSEISRTLAAHPCIEALMPAQLDKLSGNKEKAARINQDRRDDARTEEEEKSAQGAYIRSQALKNMLGEPNDTESASSGSDSDTFTDDADKENHGRKRRKTKDPADAIHQFKRRRRSKTAATPLLEAIKEAQEEDRREREADRRERAKRDKLLVELFRESCEAQRMAQKEMITLLADSLKENR
ncbi:hypothetical protein BD309DRAFT_985085 [Dichomitus squalens]|nr:hypothetical protein BD309DRAFT_985085 [Dichomitus squalens]